MRLFQSTMMVDSIPAPPPFLCPPDPSRDQLKYMSYSLMRNEKRLPTPEKVAIMELSSSFERHRLGKQQQLLTDINKRCREQEVADLSSKLTKKCNLTSSDNRGREVTFYSTTFMHKKQKTFAGFSEEPLNLPDSSRSQSPTSPRPNIEKSYKYFPARKMIKHPSKYEFQRRSLMRIKPPPLDTSPQQYSSTILAQTQNQDVYNQPKVPRLNSTLQMDQFLKNRYDPFESLLLQNAQNDKLDSITTARVNLGTRQKTNPAWGEVKSNGTTSTRSYKSSSRSLKPLKTLKDSKLPDPELSTAPIEQTT